MANVPALAISVRSTLFVTDAPGESRAPAGLRAAFDRGLGVGLLHLGGPLLHADLEPSLAFGRDLARGFYESLCRSETPPDAPPPELITRALLNLPPMSGAEYASPSTITRAWTELLAASRDELAGVELDTWLEQKNPAWHALGRVYFHLAENKRDVEFPFAFVATYVDGLADSGEPLHRTLGHALEVFAHDRGALLRLLRPLELAARNSPLVEKLVESGLVYEAVRWTPAEAHAFLQQIPICEAAGVRVRVPDWWRSPARRVVASARLGEREAAKLGIDALLDFDAGLMLGDRRLSAAETRALLNGAAGLRLVRGQWVAVDPDRLREALDSLRRNRRVGQGRRAELRPRHANARGPRWFRARHRGQRRGARGSPTDHHGRVAHTRARATRPARHAARRRSGQAAECNVARLPIARRRVDVAAVAARSRRLSGRRHGSGQDDPGAGARARREASRFSRTSPRRGARILARQLGGRSS